MLSFIQNFSPNDLVVVHQHGALKRRQLAELVCEQIDHFNQLGIVPGDRVMLLLPNSLALLVAYFACLAKGIIAVPVNNRLASREIRAIAANCKPALLISEAAELQRYGFEQSGFPCTIALAGESATSGPKQHSAGKLNETWPGSHPAIIFYTSGSTGEPKGVLYTHHTLREFSRMFMSYFQLGQNDRSVLSHCLTQNFVFCHLSLPFLQAGGSVHIVDFGNVEQTSKALQAGATFLKLIPWFANVLFKYCDQHKIMAPALRYCLLGGDRVPLALYSECRRILGVSASQNIGMTEANTYAVNLQPCSSPKIGSCGLPMPGVRVEIRDPAGQVCPHGTSGEIWVNTPAVMKGYWKANAATRKVLVKGWFATGDIGHLDEDGYLWFDGRIKQIIICNGDNIFPVEIERSIAAHPATSEVMVFGIPDERHGERVAAAVVTRKGEMLDLEALQQFLSSRLAKTKIPTDLLVLEKMPTTVAGKIDHSALMKLLMSTNCGFIPVHVETSTA